MQIHTFDNKKKFAIINAINAIYDLRELKVNQKIIFLIKIFLILRINAD